MRPLVFALQNHLNVAVTAHGRLSSRTNDTVKSSALSVRYLISWKSKGKRNDDWHGIEKFLKISTNNIDSIIHYLLQAAIEKIIIIIYVARLLVFRIHTDAAGKVGLKN